MFSAIESILVALRDEDDLVNTVVAGLGTGAIGSGRGPFNSQGSGRDLLPGDRKRNDFFAKYTPPRNAPEAANSKWGFSFRLRRIIIRVEIDR
ncbi:unnamed protein product [Linum tenue]|nr:unnamed protein product [Linum tenue]